MSYTGRVRAGRANSEGLDRKAAIATEVLVAALVAAALSVPLLSLAFQERESVQVSRFQYAAVLAARDEMYAVRFAVAAGADPATLQHAWRPLEGDPFTPLAPMATDLGVDVSYPAEQGRIETQLSIEAAPGAPPGSELGRRLRLGTLIARWREPAAGGVAERPAAVRVVFGVMSPPWVDR